jgi:hypothetical protein
MLELVVSHSSFSRRGTETSMVSGLLALAGTDDQLDRAWLHTLLKHALPSLDVPPASKHSPENLPAHIADFYALTVAHGGLGIVVGMEQRAWKTAVSIEKSPFLSASDFCLWRLLKIAIDRTETLAGPRQLIVSMPLKLEKGIATRDTRRSGQLEQNVAEANDRLLRLLSFDDRTPTMIRSIRFERASLRFRLQAASVLQFVVVEKLTPHIVKGGKRGAVVSELTDENLVVEFWDRKRVDARFAKLAIEFPEV